MTSSLLGRTPTGIQRCCSAGHTKCLQALKASALHSRPVRTAVRAKRTPAGCPMSWAAVCRGAGASCEGDENAPARCPIQSCKGQVPLPGLGSMLRIPATGLHHSTCSPATRCAATRPPRLTRRSAAAWSNRLRSTATCSLRVPRCSTCRPRRRSATFCRPSSAPPGRKASSSNRLSHTRWISRQVVLPRKLGCW